jgi:hypothetical protein
MKVNWCQAVSYQPSALIPPQFDIPYPPIYHANKIPVINDLRRIDMPLRRLKYCKQSVYSQNIADKGLKAISGISSCHPGRSALESAGCSQNIAFAGVTSLRRIFKDLCCLPLIRCGFEA